ncbi:endothelin-converting enzyme 2 [Drosophila eugracilis]|uniref:endothelin-converting enzyme 2 n=1 Tax=Drosophila eugracilis TaxID=29029 RepID=UPI0007E6F937|nr:endothelin-converting enzyme 2 [Drosophila eugracilis]
MQSLLLLCSCLTASLILIEAEVDINIATANQIHKNLNRTVSPCTDFWNFACGGFVNNSKYVDNFEWVEDQFASAMVEFMESNLGEDDSRTPRLIQKMRSYYKACKEDKQNVKTSDPLDELTDWLPGFSKFLEHGLNGVFFDERVDVAANDSTRLVIQIKMPELSASYSAQRAERLLRLYKLEDEDVVRRLIRNLQELQDKYRVENPVVFTFNYSEIKKQIPLIEWNSICSQLLGENHTSEELDQLLFEVSDMEYLQEISQFLANLDSRHINMYLRTRLFVFIEESKPRERNPKSCIHHMRAILPLGINYIYDRFVYQNRDQDTRDVDKILTHLKKTFDIYLSANRLKLTAHQLTYVRAKLKGIQLKVGNLPEEKSDEFYDNHYESANFSDSSFLANLFQALALRTRQQHAGLLNPESKLDLKRYYVNDNVVKARTSPFYENERNTITVPMEFLQWPLFDHRQHSIFRQSLLGAVLGHEMNHAFEQEGILFDAAGNESLVGLEIRESLAFRNALKCAEGKPFVSLKERLADINGLQLAYDSFFGLDHDSRLFEYRPYAFESEFTAPQLFHLSYAQFFCGSLPPVIAHDRDDERVNVSVGNLRQFAYDFKCETSDSSICEMWRSREETVSTSNGHP